MRDDLRAARQVEDLAAALVDPRQAALPVRCAQGVAADQAADEVGRAADQRLAALVYRAEDRDALDLIVQP